MGGKPNVVECAFVESNVTEAAYFATPLTLGKNGVEENNGMGTLSAFEQEKLKEVRQSYLILVYLMRVFSSQGMPELLANIKKGEEFAR